jgi:tetratricopeptide (TPR) repeat protein/Txe/YoeB family toxin of Txe-Axe toxin-antitoxin module
MLNKKILLLSVFCAAKIWATNSDVFSETQKQPVASSSVAAKRYKLPSDIICAPRLQVVGSISLPDVSLEEYATYAQSLHEQGEYLRSLYIWQKCAKENYLFSKDDIYRCTSTLTSADYWREAYDLWKWVFKTYPGDVCPDWYRGYAIAALNVEDFPSAYRVITKHLLRSEDIDAGTYLFAAQASLFTGRKQEALGHYENYFATEQPENISDVVYMNAADTYHKTNNDKAASKCMDLLFKSKKGTVHEVDVYQDAATYAALNEDPEKALGYWEIYFSIPDSKKGTTFNYARRGLAYGMIGDIEKGVLNLEKYFEFTPESEWVLMCALALGGDYMFLGKTEKACFWYDKVFAKGKGLAQNLNKAAPQDFHLAILSYLTKHDTEKVNIVMKTLQTLHPKEPFATFLSSEETPTQGRGRGAKKRVTKAKKPVEMTEKMQALAIQNHLRKSYLDRCETLKITLNNMSFEDTQVVGQEEKTRLELLQEIIGFQKKNALVTTKGEGEETSSSAKEDVSAQEDTLVDLQSHLMRFERKVHGLKRLQEKAMHARKKERSLAFLKELSELPQEVIPLSTTGNLRGLYGHAKSEDRITLSTSSTTSASTMSAMTLANASQQLHVTITLLKSAEKQHEQLQTMPGFKGKYKTFISEIMANPVQIEGTSGRTKLLHGEAGLFSRRFDKGNRMVYKVIKTSEDAYEVIFLNLLGHYKELDHQVEVMHKKQITLAGTKK